MDWNNYFLERNHQQAKHRAQMEAKLPGQNCEYVRPATPAMRLSGIVFWVLFFALLVYLVHLG